MRHWILQTIVLLTLYGVKGQNLNLSLAVTDSANVQVLDTLSYQSVFNNYNNLKHELNKIQNTLNIYGYFESKLLHLKADKLNYTATYFIGRQTPTIRIYLNEQLQRTVGAQNYNLSENYIDVASASLESFLNKLNTNVAEQGDPFSKLQLKNFRRVNPETLAADLSISQNNFRQIDSIVVKGYEKFPKAFVKHYLKLKKGRRFGLKDIKRQVDLINNLPFANQIKEPEVLFTKDSTTLYLYLEKQNINTFDGFLGFGTNETTNKLEFDGYLDLRLINNLNFGETLNLYYKSDEIDQQTFRVNAQLPYLLKSPVGLNLGLNIFRKDSTFITVNQKLQLNYQINAHHNVALGIDGVTSTYLRDEINPDFEDYQTTFFTANYNYISVQSDRLFPINFWIDFNAALGNRSSNEQKLQQQRFNLETYKIFNLNQRNSIFGRITGGYLISDNYFDNELFRLGGINSIRGFEENSLVANLYGVLNTEYRYRLSPSFYVNSVVDAAYLENSLTDTTLKLFGFGFGFGLVTKAGLFRLNYASGKTENQQFRLSDSKVHISLTATF